uniref:Uncharacterized protein n=1 Tax=Mycena chlorophos TaxID=658473 RepID=A0ABQ0M0U0_MYCCL|nr:predicted protein [Mycena chlorophos]
MATPLVASSAPVLFPLRRYPFTTPACGSTPAGLPEGCGLDDAEADDDAQTHDVGGREERAQAGDMCRDSDLNGAIVASVEKERVSPLLLGRSMREQRGLLCNVSSRILRSAPKRTVRFPENQQRAHAKHRLGGNVVHVVVDAWNHGSRAADEGAWLTVDDQLVSLPENQLRRAQKVVRQRPSRGGLSLAWHSMDERRVVPPLDRIPSPRSKQQTRGWTTTTTNDGRSQHTRSLAGTTSASNPRERASAAGIDCLAEVCGSTRRAGRHRRAERALSESSSVGASR